MQIKTTKYCYMPMKMAKIFKKILIILRAGGNVKQLELSFLSSENAKCTTILEINLAINTINIRFSNLTLGFYSNGLETCTHTICMQYSIKV